MKTQKNVGIWMDHSVADLIDPNARESKHSITSAFTSETEEEALQRSESLMHNKRQQMHETFYKEIGAEMLKYDRVLLFGPTNAKTELHNYVRKDLRFKDIIIDMEAADYISDNEKQALVSDHFKN